MAKYRKIDPRIWNDEKFASLSHEGQRTFLFILTHPSMTALGAFRASKWGLADELGIPPKEFDILFTELLRKGLLKYDEKAFFIFAPNFLKYNAPENPNVIKGWYSVLDLLPECPLKVEVLEKAKASASLTANTSKAFEEKLGTLLKEYTKAFPKPFRKGIAQESPKSMPIQEQEHIYKEEIKKVEKKKEEKSENENQNFLFEEQNETAENENSSKPKKEKKKAITFPMPYTEIPQHWVEMCHELTPDIDPFQAFTEFKLYWTVGKGAGKVTSERGWNQSWMNWLKIEAKKMTAPRYQHSGPIPPMPQRKYDQNGTLITTNKNGVRDSGFADPDYYKIKPKGY